MIGKRIKERRIKLGMTQEELAKRVGYKSKTSINKIELGINGVTQSKIASLAKALSTTPAYLMGWESAHAARICLYSDKLAALVKKLERLNESDLARIDERVNMMLESYES